LIAVKLGSAGGRITHRSGALRRSGCAPTWLDKARERTTPPRLRRCTLDSQRTWRTGPSQRSRPPERSIVRITAAKVSNDQVRSLRCRRNRHRRRRYDDSRYRCPGGPRSRLRTNLESRARAATVPRNCLPAEVGPLRQRRPAAIHHPRTVAPPGAQDIQRETGCGLAGRGRGKVSSSTAASSRSRSRLTMAKLMPEAASLASLGRLTRPQPMLRFFQCPQGD
jgi:hypothetical protein